MQVHLGGVYCTVQLVLISNPEGKTTVTISLSKLPVVSSSGTHSIQYPTAVSQDELSKFSPAFYSFYLVLIVKVVIPSPMTTKYTIEVPTFGDNLRVRRSALQ